MSHLIDLYSHLEKLTEEYLGLSFPKNRHKDLIKGLQNAAKELGIDPSLESIYSFLSEKQPKPDQLNIIAGNLTIGETYFFRERPAIVSLKETILPEIINRKRETETIRIWSAGCSSGEEPYTIAIMLKEYFQEISNWNISILATDISPKAIQKAITGIYSEWSFRETDPLIRKKYFEKEISGWRVKKEIKNMVDFGYLNLATGNFPSPLNKTSDIDLLLCRNVLMYFTPDNIIKTSNKFYECISPDGWFLTSQVELNDEYFGKFSRVSDSGGIFYRKCNKLSPVQSSIFLTSDSPKRQKKSAITKSPLKKLSSKTEKKSELRFETVVTESKQENTLNLLNLKIKERDISFLKDNIDLLIRDHIYDFEHIKQVCELFADFGLFEEFKKVTDKLLSTGTDDSEIYYLYGIVDKEKGNYESAKKNFIRSLYLNHDDIMSMIHIANILIMEKSIDNANKYLDNAINLINDIDDSEVLEKYSISKERLLDSIRSMKVNRY